MRGNAYLSGFIMHFLKLILEHSFWTPLTPLSHKMFASVVSCMLLMVQALNREDNFVKAVIFFLFTLRSLHSELL